jgi:hypothetical protein
MADLGPVRKIYAVLYLNGKRRKPEYFRLYERLALQDRVTNLLNRRIKENRVLAAWRNVGHNFATDLVSLENRGTVVCILENRYQFEIGVPILPEFLDVYLNNKFEIGSRILRNDVVEVKFLESICES